MPKNLLDNINYKNKAKQNPWLHPDLEGVKMGCDRGTGGNHCFGKQGFSFVVRCLGSFAFPCYVTSSKSINFHETHSDHL